MFKALLIGMGPTAASALESLAARLDLVGVVREAEEPAADPVVRRAAELGVPVFAETAPAAIEALVERLRPDCVVVSSYNRILRPALVERVRCVNVHYAPLPEYRGRANVNWAIINDEPEAAISVHVLAPGLDAGDILYQERIPIGERATVAEVYAALNAIQRERLAETVIRFLEGDGGAPQREEDATYGCTRVAADGEIDWRATTRRIDCLIRALAAPYPGAFTYLDGRRLIVWAAEPAPDAPRYVGRVPGRVVNVSRARGHVDVLTGDGVLRLIEVEAEGGERTAAANVIKSVRSSLGLQTGDLLERIRRLEEQLALILAERQP